MKIVIKVKRFKVGYELRYEIDEIEYEEKKTEILIFPYCKNKLKAYKRAIPMETFSHGWRAHHYVVSAYTNLGHYIGDSKWAYRLYKRGIIPELISDKHKVCSIGFCQKEQKWYGWSHRAIFGFGVGDVVKEGDCAASSGWTEEYLKDHPEENLSLPIGFEAKTLDDARRIAIAFAESVS